jgi:hypothetical protein
MNPSMAMKARLKKVSPGKLLLLVANSLGLKIETNYTEATPRPNEAEWG